MTNPIPEFYGDILQVTTNNFGVTITVFRTNPDTPNQQPDQVARFRISLELYKLLSLMSRRDIRNMESSLGGDIRIPFIVLNSMGLSMEDL